MLRGLPKAGHDTVPPSAGAARRTSSRRKLLLPEPFAPVTSQCSPGMRRQVTSCSTWRPASQMSASLERNQQAFARRRVRCAGAALDCSGASRRRLACALRSRALDATRGDLEVARRAAAADRRGTCAAHTTRAFAADELEHRRRALRAAAIETARRLVEQQHRRRERDAARDQHAALLAARQLEKPARSRAPRRRGAAGRASARSRSPGAGLRRGTSVR